MVMIQEGSQFIILNTVPMYITIICTNFTIFIYENYFIILVLK